MTYCDYCYRILSLEAKGMDAVYEDFILHLLGIAGLTELRSNNCLEPCGLVNGRQLYALCGK